MSLMDKVKSFFSGGSAEQSTITIRTTITTTREARTPSPRRRRSPLPPRPSRR